mmetsp:Transcript_104680/g.176900  ORF Transcript_104680/g.176900 Transcript_104680/m.176900 type:complete len:175 (+) Transcript_104680:628-1152(+)
MCMPILRKSMLTTGMSIIFSRKMMAMSSLTSTKHQRARLQWAVIIKQQDNTLVQHLITTHRSLMCHQTSSTTLKPMFCLNRVMQWVLMPLHKQSTVCHLTLPFHRCIITQMHTSCSPPNITQSPASHKHPIRWIPSSHMSTIIPRRLNPVSRMPHIITHNLRCQDKTLTMQPNR